MNFMLFVDCDPDKPTVPEVFGIDRATLSSFLDKVVERYSKPIEHDRTTDVFFDALNEMPEDQKAGIVMTMAVAQMTNQINTIFAMHGFGEMLKKMLEDRDK